MITDGLLGALSAFSVHGYTPNIFEPEDLAPYFSQLEAFLGRHPVKGHPLPMVMSEYGYQSLNPLPKGGCCTLAVQADYVVRLMLDDLQSGTVLSVWYDFMGPQWGVITNPWPCDETGCTPTHSTPKPSYTAVQVLDRTLSGQNYVAADDVAACANGEHAIRLSKGGEAFWAVYPANPNPTAVHAGRFYVGSNRVTLVSQYGTRSQATATNGVLSAYFQPAVTYLLGASGRVPPPPPSHVRFPSSVASLMTQFFTREPAGSPMSLMGSPVGQGKVALLWHPLCGVGSYQILSGASAKGPWHVQGSTRKSIWIGTAPTSATWYTVRSVSPAGVTGPVAPALQTGA